MDRPQFLDARVPRSGREAVVRRMAAIAPLDPAAQGLLEKLDPAGVFPAHTEMADETSRAPHPRFIIGGWAARVRSLPDGRRQILGFLIPGDSVGLCEPPSPLVLGATTALTKVTALDAGPVQAAYAGGDPQWRTLAAALDVSAALHEVYLLNQVTRLGRMTAYERLCHLLLEIGERLRLAGIGDGARFPMPLTQEVLADALGLSVVHINRVLQQLRRDGHLELRSGIATLRDRTALSALCDYSSPRPAAWLPGA